MSVYLNLDLFAAVCDVKYADPRQPVQGILSGTAPVLILDASGTMNPRMGGRFPTVKSVAAQLLSPDEGQIRNTAGMFDVIAYSGQAWAWSATCKRKYAMLKENKGGNVRGRPYSGAPTSSTLRQLRERGNMQEQVMPCRRSELPMPETSSFPCHQAAVRS